MKCGHNDCFSCPYPDCILSETNVGETGAKRGRKPLTPEERKARHRARAKRYYYENKEHYREIRKAYYERTKAV